MAELVKSSLGVGVEHDSNLGSEGSGGQVSMEDSSNGTGVSVLHGDLSPSHSVPSVVLESFGFVDVGNLLSKIVIGVFFVIDSLNAEEVEGLVLVPESSLESSEHALSVESKKIRRTTTYLTGWVLLWSLFDFFTSVAALTMSININD